MVNITDERTSGCPDFNSRLRAHAAATPSKLALSFLPSSWVAKRVDLTYNDLVEWSSNVAQFLSNKFEAGERVLLLLPAIPEFAAAFLGCLAANVIAVPLPLPTNEGARRRVMSVAKDCAPSAIMSIPFVHELISRDNSASRLCKQYAWVFINDIEAAPGPLQDANPSDIPSERIAFLQYTSGSTATPRGVMVSHRNLMVNEAAISESFQVSTDSTIVSWLPLHHDMGLIGGLLQPLYAGARGVMLDPASFVRRPVSWLEAISDERADISGGPNFAYELCTRRIGARQKARLDLRNWRIAFNGAAPVFPRTLQSFSNAFSEVGFQSSAHVPCYGLAEATLLVSAANPPTSPFRSFSTESLERGAAHEVGSQASLACELVRYPLQSHTSVKVIDRVTSKPLSDGFVGEIVVGGENVSAGYWNDPAKTSETFALTLPDEPARCYARTGDLGFVFEGELFIQGRKKDLIIHRGRNLHPEDLEADTSVCDSALRPECCAVFGMPHEGDEAVVVCHEIYNATPLNRYKEIAHNIRTMLARIHGVTVHTVILVSPHTIPKTTSGKLQRYSVANKFFSGDLPALYVDTIEEPSGAQLTRLSDRLAATGGGTTLDEFTITLCEHIRDLLNLPTTPAGEQSLTSLGMDSMIAAQLHYDIEEALGIVSLPSMALRVNSIAELAAAVQNQASVNGPSVSSHAEESEYELNSGQRALWFLQQVSPQNTAYNITRGFRITGALDVEKLAAALTRVISRHRSLRLSVLNVNGEPRPRICPPGPVSIDVVDACAWDEQEILAWHHRLATTPFDLERDSLIRASVLRSADEWLLVFMLHHIVCDGSSLSIIVSDLAEEYRTETATFEPQITAQVTDVGLSPGALERAVLEKRGAELEAYWRNELDGEIPRLSFTQFDSGRPGSASSLTFTLDTQQTSKLVLLVQESGLTLHNLVLAAWQVLLHRLTSQSDILVGVPVSLRNDRRLRTAVGYLVNVVPIRSSLDSSKPFLDFAQQTQQRVFDAVDHKDLPLSLITRFVNVDRDNASSSIFQAMFAYYTTALPAGQNAAAVLTNDPNATLSLGAATLHSHPFPDYTTQSEVCLNVYARTDTLTFELQSDPERVSLEQIKQLTTTFVTLLESICKQPTSRVRQLSLLTPDEIQEQVAKSFGMRRSRPPHYLRSFEQMVESCADRVAADDGVRRLSYVELDQRTNRVAWRLRELNVGIDGNVVVSAARSVDYLVALLGIHKADGCYVPISPREAPQRAAAMIASIDPVVCIADSAGRALLMQAIQAAGVTKKAILDLQGLADGLTERPPARMCPSLGSSYIIHTSGSTAAPKPVISTNAGLTNHLWQMIEYFNLGPQDCIGQTGPVSFDISVWQLLAPLIIGAQVQIVPEPTSLSPTGLLDATVRGGVTLLELVPSALVALMDAGLAQSRHALRIMIATGEALNSDLPRRWAHEMPQLPLYNAYGPCECTDDVSIGLSASGSDVPTSVSIGRPLTNTSTFIVDDDMQPVPIGVAGRLCVGGAGVGRGYLNDARRTATVFIPDPWSDVPGSRLYWTGDLARMAPNGNLEFLGRTDNQIKIRGVRIEPGEVEAALCECDGVAEAAVKVERGTGGALLTAFIVMRDNGFEAFDDLVQPLSPDEYERLRAVLVNRLPRHMIPSVLVRVSRLPRSPNGKTDYRALSYRPSDTTEKDDEADRFDDALAATIRSIWAASLGVDVVNQHDNFFQLGGHSLLALSLIDEIGRVTNREISIDLIFAYPRLREFVAALRRSPQQLAAATIHSRSFGSRRGPVPASAAQQRFWFLHEKDPGQSTFNMSGVLSIRGLLEERVIDAALRDVLDRHPLLLSSFSDDGGTLTWTSGSADDFVLRRLDLRGAVAEFGEDVFERLANTEANTAIDLRREVPFRAMLAQLGAVEWRLFVCFHHIACDAWSLGVFLKDLADSYNRHVRELPTVNDEIRNDFADYCYDELARRERSNGFEFASEWRTMERGPIRRSPRFLPRATAHKSINGRHSFSIARNLGTALRDLTGRARVTPFMFFATALSALIHSGSENRETIMLGTLIAQRERAEWQHVVGPLLNVSVLVIELTLRDTVFEALQGTQKAALLAYRSHNLPYQELIGLLEPAAKGDGSPFDVLLVMQPESGKPPDFDGLTTELIEIDTGASPYPLVVDIEPRDGGYRVTHRFARDRYSSDDIQQFTERFDALIFSMATNPDDTLEEILNRTGTVPLGGIERT